MSIHGVPVVGYRGTFAPPTIVRAEPEFRLEFPNERGQRNAVPGVRRGSVLDYVRQQGDLLAHRPLFSVFWLSPPGARAACVWLLLTGRPMPLAPILTVTEVPGYVDAITVTALARVASPKTVLAAFGTSQRRALGKRKGRPFEDRSIEIVGFVERDQGSPPGTLTDEQWSALWKKWNRTRPRRMRFRVVGEMRGAYERAVESFFPLDSR